MPKYDTATSERRPLHLECRGGPLPSMRVYEKQPLEVVPITEETGGRGPDGSLPIVGQYVLEGDVYVYEAVR